MIKSFLTILVFLALVFSCSPSSEQGSRAGLKSFTGLSQISSEKCAMTGGKWMNGRCSVSVSIEEAKTPEECGIFGGQWDAATSTCSKEELLGAVLNSAQTEAECQAQGGLWQGESCFVREDDISLFAGGDNNSGSADCVAQGGTWNGYYCDGAFLDPNAGSVSGACDPLSVTYDQFACQSTGETGCVNSGGVWDTNVLSCECGEGFLWSSSLFLCELDQTGSESLHYQDQVLLEIQSEDSGEYAPIYVLELTNIWATHKSWTFRNDYDGNVVVDDEDDEDSESPRTSEEGGELNAGTCYSRFKIVKGDDPESTDIIRDEDLITLQSVGLCEDEDYCDVYFNRDTSVNQAAITAIAITVGVTSILTFGGSLVAMGIGAGVESMKDNPDFGHLMVHDQYIEDEANLEWSEFTGSDKFLLEMTSTSSSVDPNGMALKKIETGDEQGYSLSFTLTSKNDTHEDRDGFYLISDKRVVLATKGDDGENERAKFRVLPCLEACQELAQKSECWQ